MAEIYKIATPNIKGLQSHTRIAMLGEFMRKQEIDFIFLQEVTQPKLHTIRGYAAYTNIRKNRRDTAKSTTEHVVSAVVVILDTQYIHT